jgi:hypothetical protein
MPVGIREHLADMSDCGVSFAELVCELDVYKDRMPPRQYDELWLFCWSLAKRQAARPLSGSNGDPWPGMAG